MRKSYLFALAGLLLGICAPLGALLWFCTTSHPIIPLPSFILQVWAGNSFFFNYMLVGTSLVFALFGYFIGQKEDVLLKEVLTDPLTGLGNHRFLHDVFKIEFRKHMSTRQPLSCLMMDLDRFKNVNDTYGHPFGDVVLKHFAALVKKSIRQGDTATRYGGEEFLCILPNCDKEEARAVSERIRHTIESYSFAHQEKKVRITVSVGTVTGYERTGTNYRHLIVLADQALYEAKRRGRNRVVQLSLDGRKAATKKGKRRKQK